MTNDKQYPFLIENHLVITSNKQEVEKIRKICKHEEIYKKIEKIKEWKKSSSPSTSDIIGDEGHEYGMARWEMHFFLIQTN